MCQCASEWSKVHLSLPFCHPFHLGLLIQGLSRGLSPEDSWDFLIVWRLGSKRTQTGAARFLSLELELLPILIVRASHKQTQIQEEGRRSLHLLQRGVRCDCREKCVIIFGHNAVYPFFLILFSLKVLLLCIILFIMCLLHWLDTLESQGFFCPFYSLLYIPKILPAAQQVLVYFLK